MGKWSEIQIGGHSCDVFEPASVSPFGYVILYLHGVHMGRLVDQPRFEQTFDVHGVKVLAPQVGRSWWTDKICTEFDSEITAERYVLEDILPWIDSTWTAKPPQI